MHSSHAAAARDGAACEHEHNVEFYETTAFLIGTIADFVVPALRGGHSAIVVATPGHLAAFATAISAERVDLQAAIREDRYQAYDAGELLSRFMVGGMPDRALFERTATQAIDRAAAAGRNVKVYGEMVALLWADGDVDATIALEDMWNDLAATRSFSLLCGYPMQDFDDAARAAFKRICTQHTTVIATDPARTAETPPITELHQETMPVVPLARGAG
jgi:hypothetical protein